MTQLWIALIIFTAIFTQSSVGFGLALVSMPLLAATVGIRVATPLVALVGLTAEGLLLYHYRAALNLQAVKRLTLASLIGVPVGVWAFSGVSEAVILPLLGAVITGYALYALFAHRLPARMALPRLEHARWADGFGLVAGVLSGAYNTPGPPVIIYGNCRRWQPAEFKSNLQGFFIVNSTIVVLAHLVAGNFTSDVMQAYAVSLPAILLGALGGFALDGRLEPRRFHRVVLFALVGLGVSLIL